VARVEETSHGWLELRRRVMCLELRRRLIGIVLFIPAQRNIVVMENSRVHVMHVCLHVVCSTYH
jgi:hypothetical protein